MKHGTLGATLALTGIIYGAACWGSAVQACSNVITWQADLAAPTAVPLTPSAAAGLTPAAGASPGKATIEFDFVHPGATFRVETKVPGTVQEITLHVTRTFSDPTGPKLFTLYTAAAGPLPAVYTKRVGEADLLKQPSLKILTLTDAVRAVLDGRAYVTVTPKIPQKATARVAALPELSGFITMHKEEVYSDRPGDAVHDPALHGAVKAAP